MLAFSSYDYAVVRVVPRVERGEFLNVGVILYSRGHRFLGSAIELDEERLAALAPRLAASTIRPHLAMIPMVCTASVGSGPICVLSQAERFHWLVSPRSTVIQTSPVHCGITSDPASTLERLVRQLVRLPY
jgi:hypothetical protein